MRQRQLFTQPLPQRNPRNTCVVYSPRGIGLFRCRGREPDLYNNVTLVRQARADPARSRYDQCRRGGTIIGCHRGDYATFRPLYSFPTPEAP